MATQNSYIDVGTKRKNKLSFTEWLQTPEGYRTAVISLGAFFVLVGSFAIGMTDLGLIAVAGALGIGVTLGVLARPHFGMYFLTLFVYTNLSTVLNEAFGVPSLNKILVALIFVAVIGTRVVLQRKPLLFRSVEGAVLLYMVVTTVSTLISTGLNAETFDNIVDVFKDFIIIFIIVQLATEEGPWKNTQWLLIGSAVGLSVLTWYQFGTGNYAQDFFGLATSRADSVQDEYSSYVDFFRVGGPLGDPNYYAQMLVMVFPLAFYRFITDPIRFRRLAAGAALILISGAIIFTYSRATLLVLIFIVGLMLFERRVQLWKIVIGAAIVLAISYPLLPTSFKARMLTIVGLDATSAEQDDVSAQGRLSEALAAMQMFQDYPVFGIGYSQYEPNYQDYSARIGLDQRIEQRQAHNLYLEIAAETGIVGIVSFIIMIFFVYQTAMETRRNLRELGREDLIPWAAAFHFMLIAYMLNSIFLHDDYARYLRLAIGFVASGTAMTASLRANMLEKQNRPKYKISTVELPTRP